MLASTLSAPTSTSIFADTPTAPPDAILGLNVAFRADTSPDKVNLGVGAYRTADNKPYVLPVVRRVEAALAAEGSAHNHEYLPQAGLDDFSRAAARLLFGDDSPALAAGRVVTVQALSGTGALRVAFAFCEKFAPKKGATLVLIPNPTWSNHKNIVPDAGLRLGEYRYFDAVTGGVDIENMLADIGDAPDGSVVLLHACAHNPTGADPTTEQWKRILDVCVAKRHVPLFDNAYQGFASGDLHVDAAAVRMFVAAGIDMMTCQSFAKNAGLYGERIGAFSVVCASAEPVAAIRTQLSRIIRGLYSSPPKHGAAIMAQIIGDPKLFEEWQGELTMMSTRIKLMRTQLKAALDKNEAPGNWDRITNQIGMFSYTGMTSQQVKYMRDHYHIYMTGNGRISMAGLTEPTVTYVADAMKEALLSVVKQD